MDEKQSLRTWIVENSIQKYILFGKTRVPLSSILFKDPKVKKNKQEILALLQRNINPINKAIFKEYKSIKHWITGTIEDGIVFVDVDDLVTKAEVIYDPSRGDKGPVLSLDLDPEVFGGHGVDTYFIGTPKVRSFFQ